MSVGKIVITGDALVDMVGDASYAYQAFPGGSCFNVAMALGRLGRDVGFACPISSDALGKLLSKTLTDSGVDILMSNSVPDPTPLAVVSIDAEGKPTYAFYRDRTADRTVTDRALTDALPASVSMIHVGSLALIEADDSPAWMAGLQAGKERGALVSLDPNVRPTLIDDFDDYRHRMEDFLAIADLIKVSDEDLEILRPGMSPEAAFEGIIENHRPALGLLTLGESGSLAVTAGGLRIRHQAIAPGPIADTIGAGDSLQAGLMSALADAGAVTADELADIGEPALRAALRIGSLAAGINCTRQGCNPPWKDELASALAELN